MKCLCPPDMIFVKKKFTSTFANSKKFTRSKRVNCNILDVRYIYIYRNSTACDVCDKYHVCSLHSKINMRIYFKSWTRHYVIFFSFNLKIFKDNKFIVNFQCGTCKYFPAIRHIRFKLFMCCIQVNSFVQLLLKFRLTLLWFYQIQYTLGWNEVLLIFTSNCFHKVFYEGCNDCTSINSQLNGNTANAGLMQYLTKMIWGI